MENYRFIDENGSFELEQAQDDRGLYFPIAGENGIKSSVSPILGGDIKLDQNHFLMEPVSIENLNNNKSTRNFWCIVKNQGVWSATGASVNQEELRFTDMEEESGVRAGLMWHETYRISKRYQLESKIISFVPIQKNLEIMLVSITNVGKISQRITPVAAVPLYGRSADNIRDHRHVTSLLNRSVVTKYGVRLKPTLSFDERGHQKNDTVYFVEGMTGNGKAPESFYPDLDGFTGRAGSLERPEAVVCDIEGEKPGFLSAGSECLGGLRFETIMIGPGETAEFVIFIGAVKNEEDIEKLRAVYPDSEAVKSDLEMTKQYWINKVNTKVSTGDADFNQFMNWVNFQPELRRIYGCSFLPHHDYGKGGRGWRDLWQDCQALLLMNPGGVRQMLLGNFSGIRVDGTNATIIGEHPGEFKADRNSITRVWMDHGVWPFMTTKLYIDQTGDVGILYQKVPYFKDGQVMRGTGKDDRFHGESDWQMDEREDIYKGTVLEHILIQLLTSFYEVGEHNHVRLRDADWNDAMDMAGERGESVAFTNAYAMDLEQLAGILRREAETGNIRIELLQEVEELLVCDNALYEDVDGKQKLLKSFGEQVSHSVSGIQIKIDTRRVADSLMDKAEWLKEHIRKTEWIEDGTARGWFNGYYDNSGRKLEGNDDEDKRMLLTSQVFAVMAGTATEEQVEMIIRAADEYLYDENCGGYRLNTDFAEMKSDMGRMFGFAYGEKENGAVFSHMAVMYANALYGRGYAKEGYKALRALYLQSMNFERSRIYPGIPEYFGKDGRGLYHYLTGAASWYTLTVMTKMYGVKGEYGNLVLEPLLLAEQFDGAGRAGIAFQFAGRSFELDYENPGKLTAGEYRIREYLLDGVKKECHCSSLSIDRTEIEKLDAKKTHHIQVTLEQ